MLVGTPAGLDPAILAGGVLTVDLAAVAGNWRALAERVAPAECAAVVKADAYGLGARAVAPALVRAGCRTLFVAHADEGVALRDMLGPGPRILVLHGFLPGAEAAFDANGLEPVLSARWQVEEWSALARTVGRRLPAVLQVDSGMTRFGLSGPDLDALLSAPAALDAMDVTLVMSHLACADEPDHPANAAQLAAFRTLCRRLPSVPASLAASSGIFLGEAYRFDLVRPGAALYGVAPQPGRPNPMRPVVRLRARVVQTRTVGAGTPVGYGWTARTEGPARLATVSAGYADGLFRALSNRGAAWLDGTRLPLIGRVSMDSIVVDVSGLPEDAVGPGTLLDLVGPDQTVDDLARAAGTIGYEVLTALGGRYDRVYDPA